MKEKIISECKENNARAYLRINKRNDRKLALFTLNAISTSLATLQHKNIKEIMESAAGRDYQFQDLIDVNVTQKTHITNMVMYGYGLLKEAILINPCK